MSENPLQLPNGKTHRLSGKTGESAKKPEHLHDRAFRNQKINTIAFRVSIKSGIKLSQFC